MVRNNPNPNANPNANRARQMPRLGGLCGGIRATARHRIHVVTEGEMNQGCWWLDDSKEFWSFMKPMHHKAGLKMNVHLSQCLQIAGSK